MTTVKYFTFFEKATAAQTSRELPNASTESLILSVSGENFSGKLHVEGNLGGTWQQLAVVRLLDIEVLSYITECPRAYTVVCPEGFVAFRVVIDEMDDGEVTVVARCTTEV